MQKKHFLVLGTNRSFQVCKLSYTVEVWVPWIMQLPEQQRRRSLSFLHFPISSMIPFIPLILAGYLIFSSSTQLCVHIDSAFQVILVWQQGGFVVWFWFLQNRSNGSQEKGDKTYKWRLVIAYDGTQFSGSILNFWCLTSVHSCLLFVYICALCFLYYFIFAFFSLVRWLHWIYLMGCSSN